ncbi:MAG: ABC transporter permease [Candidatus Dormibacteraeota bacterium]|nr:ABC transporter permease [Candidatus Dormibacteraeota bacterium]
MATTDTLREGTFPSRPRAPQSGPWARHLELLWELVRRDVRARYRGSVLGIGWTLLNPLVFMLVYALVFGSLLKVQGPSGKPYLVFLLSGLLAWTFFQQALVMAASSIIANAGVVRKVAFPWMLLTVSTVTASLVNFLISLVLLVPFLIASHSPVGLPLLALPGLIVVTFGLCLGLGLMLAAGSVYFRDLQYIINLATMVWFYLSPVIWPLSRYHGFFGHGKLGLLAHAIVYANPMTWVVVSFQDIFVFNRWPQHWHGLIYTTVLAVALIWIGLLVFRRLRRRFAEEI